jgi:hypothetical protein
MYPTVSLGPFLLLMLRCCLQIVLKSQIYAGGRGLGTFKNGLQGGVHICSVNKAIELAKQMLNQTLVTKQTGPAGALQEGAVESDSPMQCSSRSVVAADAEPDAGH